MCFEFLINVFVNLSYYIYIADVQTLVELSFTDCSIWEKNAISKMLWRLPPIIEANHIELYLFGYFFVYKIVPNNTSKKINKFSETMFNKSGYLCVRV